MSALRLLTAISATLVLLAKADEPVGSTPTITTNYSVTLGDEKACLSEINAAREKANLKDFVAAAASTANARLPDADTASANMDGWVWRPVCEYLIPGEKQNESPLAATMRMFESGTYAFEAVDSSTPGCDAVVDIWKKAYTNFSGLPPPYTQGFDKLYKNQDNVSLVAMYNPSSKATADCRVVTCTKTITTTPKAKEGSEGENGTSVEKKTGFALICMTTPDVLSPDSETGPFTEEQWDNIVTAIKGSASVVGPTLIGLAAVFLGIATAM